MHAHPYTCAVPAVQIRVPGQAPLAIALALDSGPLASGLLGKTSLTYQLVGRPFDVAWELANSQPGVSFMVRAAVPVVPAVPAGFHGTPAGQLLHQCLGCGLPLCPWVPTCASSCCAARPCRHSHV